MCRVGALGTFSSKSEASVSSHQEPEAMEDIRERRPSKHSRASAHMNSQELWQQAQDLHRSKHDGALALR